MGIDMQKPYSSWNYGLTPHNKTNDTYGPEVVCLHANTRDRSKNEGSIYLWLRKQRDKNDTAYLTPDEAEALGLALIELANKQRQRLENK